MVSYPGCTLCCGDLGGDGLPLLASLYLFFLSWYFLTDSYLLNLHQKNIQLKMNMMIHTTPIQKAAFVSMEEVSKLELIMPPTVVGGSATSMGVIETPKSEK